MLVAAHVVLGLLAHLLPFVGTAHALVTLVIAARIALLERRPERIAMMAAYVAGCDVFWRMVGASVFWESGKYGLIMLTAAGAIRLIPTWQRAALPLAYFVLLLPSAVITVLDLGPRGTKDAISFNLSGPLALATTALFFSHIRSTHQTFRRLLATLLLPVAAISAVALYSTITAGSALQFTGEANFVTSGGFGPDQVSALLGLGSLCCLLLAMTERNHRQRLFQCGLGLVFFAQALLTLARGGVVNVVVAGALAAICTRGRTKSAVSFLGILLVLVLVAGYVVIPRLETITGGALGNRYTQGGDTGRTSIAAGDLTLWYSHPLIGVGPGLGFSDRTTQFQESVAAHTEFTRLLAEHGAFGLCALVILLGIALRSYVTARFAYKAYVAALAAWSLVEMAHAAMRVAPVAFVFGLMTCQITSAVPAHASIDSG